MAHLTAEEQFEDLKRKVEGTVRDYFPIKGRRTELVLKSVSVDDKLDIRDLRGQKKAIKEGKTWAVPVYADLSLRRNGKEIDRRKVQIMRLPKTTDRLGYIVDGNEHQVLNQFRLKAGVYHRRAANDQLLAEFNLANPDQFANYRTFKIRFDPDKAVFSLLHKNSDIPIYHMLRGMGVSDDQLEKTWGKKILERNKDAASEKNALSRFYKAIHGQTTKEPEKYKQLLGELLQKTKLLPETTEKTLGKAHSTVNEDVLLRSMSNLLGMSRGTHAGDDRHSLEFQSIHSVEDLIDGRLRKAASRIKRRILNNIDNSSKRSVRSIVPSDAFDRSIKTFFNSSLATQPEQTNPLEMLAGQQKTTIMGEQGGYKSPHAVSEEAKLINPSHLGFLDPLHTPEGDKTGISLSLPLGVRKKGTELQAAFQDPKTGRKVMLSAGQAVNATVAFPDQYDQSGRKPKARRDLVKATRNGEIVQVRPGEVDFIIPSPRALFGVTSNLIPFLQNNQGNRAMTGARQQEQAVPLVNREAPLVQVKTDRERSFEEVLGNYAVARAPIDGMVHQVKSDAIIIKKGRKKYEVQIYRNFPLKGHTVYDSDVRVKAGDQVKKGQLLADSTFTRDGVLALGTNLKTAYLPFMGYNFEDGIVVSESAAKKLASKHLYRKDRTLDTDTIVSKKKFLAEHPYAFNTEQTDRVDDDGVIKVGQIVVEGDPLIMSLRKPSPTAIQKMIRTFRRGRPETYRDNSVTWDKPYQGVVTDVVQRGRDITVYVKTHEPAQIGDKIVGRHGNKGVITRIVPDSEMPYQEDKEGEKTHIDVAMNPLGVPGRINLGQILETAAGKIAEKRGRPYKVRNFEYGKNYLEDVRKDLKEAGLEDKEVLIDPRTGKPFREKVLVGNQYIFKLKHQVGKKISARSGGFGMPYNINHAPSGGPPHGGQSLGELGMYSLLAHGARENLHEMFAYKTNKNDDVWSAIREGTPLPPPKVPFAYDKFLKYLNAMRVDVKKEGNHMTLVPFTEEQVHSMSNGELAEPGLAVRAKDLREERGGLFDPVITGGREGTRWSHFKLAEPMPNPLFEDAVKKLTGLSGAQYQRILRGEEEIHGKRGGLAIEEMLKRIDVSKERKVLEEKIKKVKGDRRNQFHKRLRILKALEDHDLDPTVYMMRSVPVLPPIFRPITVKEDGSLSQEDVNGLYRDIAATNDALRIQKDLKAIPEKYLAPQRLELYDGLKALAGLGGNPTREYRGILDVISGKSPTGEGSPKHGFFQRTVLKRRQDFTGRSTIIPEPRMGLDELGLPEDIAWNMYKPFIERELIQAGWNPMDALKAVKSREPAAERALDKVIDHKPVLLKRDPALHKFNVMAFKPRLTKGKAIEVHPLVTAGYNADFDGDAMGVFLPITSKAEKEAHTMYPSNNLFNPTTGAVMYTPGHEALLGIYLLSKAGKKTKHSFRSLEDVRSAHKRGRIEMTDVVRLGGHETTLGRLEIESVLPKSLRETGKRGVSRMTVLDKEETKKLLTRVAKTDPQIYGEVANKLKDLGNQYSYDIGFSIGLDDFAVVNKEKRDAQVAAAERLADRIRRNKRLSAQEKERRVVELYKKLDTKVDKLSDVVLKQKPTNIYKMVTSGSRGSTDQLKQIVSSPMLVMDAKNRVVPYLIPQSYSEGMDMGSYWTTLHGARKGTIQKVQGVQQPGLISKQIMNSSMNLVVSEADCGTKDGINLGIDDHDINDRYLSTGIRVGGRRFRAGTLVTPSVVAAARKSRRTTIPVRSPMRCESDHGICKKCMGLDVGGKAPDIGTNVGVIAGQAIGEPSTQLALNVFHTGGLAKGRGARSVSTFERLRQLLRMPKNLPNAAPLALSDGTVKRIEKAPQGGEYVDIGDKRHYIPAAQSRTVKRNQRIKKGEPISDGLIDPKKLLILKGMRSVQDFMSEELHGVLAEAAPVRRRNIETVVKALTNVTRIEDPGDHPDWVSGDIRSHSQVQAYNRKRRKVPVQHTPVLKGVEVLPLEMQEDWVARLNFTKLKDTLTTAAREGWRSNIHGFHPIPAAAYGAEFGKKEKVPGWRGQY